MDFRFSPLYLIIVSVVIYLGWAVFKHYKDKSISLEIMIEYLLTALLVTIIVLGITA